MARCTVERLMRRQGAHGVRRGKVVRTTVSDSKAVCPQDKVNRQSRGEPIGYIPLQRLRHTTTGSSPVKPPRWRPDLNQMASTNSGAIHRAFVLDAQVLHADRI